MTALAVRRLVKDESRDAYHGVPVLRLHVDDPIPNPRAPERYAVPVHPDLARHWLTLNHPENRKAKPKAVKRYVRDMRNGWWVFAPEPLIFSQGGVLQNGQNRLLAVAESGVTVWLMVDFGWPEDLIQRIDRGASRTNADALSMEGIASATTLSGAYSFVVKYGNTVGTPLRWGQVLPTASEALEAYREDSDRWHAAILGGRRAYDSIRGLGPSTWTAAHFIIAGVRGIEEVDRFYNELVEESGEAGSATRRLKSHYLRRKLTDTVTGDPREPMENIVRAFNAWTTGKPVGFVRVGGAFVLSAVRKP